MKVSVNIEPDLITKILDEAINKGLNINNFIYLCPEATSVKELSPIFWNELSGQLQKLGYDIYINKCNDKDRIKNVKSFRTNITETYILAQKAKYIIGMRSGLLEVLVSGKKIPTICLYNGDNRMKRNSIKRIKALDYNELIELDFDKNEKVLDEIIKKVGDSNKSFSIT